MIQPVEIKVGEELAGQIAERQAAPALQRREQIIAGIVDMHRLLRIRAVDDRVDQPERALASDAAAEVLLEDRVVDRREVAEDVAAQDVGRAVAEALVAGDGACVPLPSRLA